MRALIVTAIVLLGLGVARAEQAAPAVPASPAQVQFTFAPLVKKAQPAVVNVYASRTDARPQNPLFDDPIFRHFFGGDGAGPTRPGGATAQSLGSGVIVDPSGLIVTNFHVIDGMNEVKIALADKREFEAEIVLRDQRTDLAILRIKGAAPFPVLELGDSDALEVGDFVVAIGNPFGVGQTVTQGIVSALARTQIGASDYQFFIQTDAAINPGNSGGALIDMRGRLAGINSAIYSRSGGSMGIGFAIPVNMVRIVVAAARGGGRQVRRPWLGATLQAVSAEIADTLAMSRPAGALVADLSPKSPAAEAGLRRGDVITAVDGQSVEDPDGFGYRLGVKPLGGTASLNVLRAGKATNVALRLAPAPENPTRDPVKLQNRSPFAGATVVNLSPAVIEEFSIEGVSEGVMVAEVEEGSNAADAGLQKGDVIVAVNDDKMATSRDMQAATADAKRKLLAPGRLYWKLTIARGGRIIQTIIAG